MQGSAKKCILYVLNFFVALTGHDMVAATRKVTTRSCKQTHIIAEISSKKEGFSYESRFHLKTMGKTELTKSSETLLLESENTQEEGKGTERKEFRKISYPELLNKKQLQTLTTFADQNYRVFCKT